MRGRLPLTLLSFVALLALWQVAAVTIDHRLLPPPWAVFTAVGSELTQGPLLYHTAITLARVAASFVLAMVIGTAIGLVMGRLAGVDRLFDPWLVVFLNLPALVVIVLAYVWFGLIEAAAVGAVAINKIPTVVVTVREGARALDRDLLQMAESFRLSRWRTLRYVVMPQLYPYLMAAARSGLALIWKIVLVVELLGRPNGIGFQIHLFFQLFDVRMILAYTLSFIVVVQLIELLALQPLERRLSRWRT